MMRKKPDVTIFRHILCVLIAMLLIVFLFKSVCFLICYFRNDNAIKIDNISNKTLAKEPDKEQGEHISRRNEKPSNIKKTTSDNGPKNLEPSSDSRPNSKLDKNPEQQKPKDNISQGVSNKPSPTASCGSYDSAFSDSIFIGDSITEGLSAFELISDSKVISKKGFTIKKAKLELNQVVKAKPHRIYIQLGLNDMLYEINSEEYVSRYLDFVQALQNNLPDTKIYIQSIFPVSANIENERPLLSNQNIDEFNHALRGMCDKQGICFIDVSSLLKDEHGRLDESLSSDGIHLKFQGYGLWLDYLKNVK